MKSLEKRRWTFGVTAAALAVVCILTYEVLQTGLAFPAIASGWLLFAMVAVLSLFNLRKKIPILPLGSASTWLQIHIYMGALSAVVFVLHIGKNMPQGLLEIGLAAVFLGVVVSGAIGLYISRAFPRRLTNRGGESIFELVPVHLRELRESADQVALDSVEQTGYSTVAVFYEERLRPYLYARPRIFAHVMNSSITTARILEAAETKLRYVNEHERQFLERIMDCVREKDDLDHQYALQLCLKGWLFTHIPLTYALWLFVVLHVALVHGFSGRL